MSRRGIKGVLATGLAAALLCASAADASAADFLVTSALDDNSGGTLREQVDAAGNGDTVIINPGINPSLTSGVEIAIDADITIRGQGPGSTTVDGLMATRNRVFNVQSGVTATIENLRITRGQAPNGVTLGPFGTAGASGGGITSSGGLTLDSVLIDACSAGRGGNGGTGADGPAPAIGGPAGNGGNGGAVFSNGTGLTLIDSTIQSNESGVGGDGGTGGSDTDIGGQGADGGNGGGGGGGGAIATGPPSTLTVTGSTINNNDAMGGGNGGAGGTSPLPASLGAGGDGGPGGGGGGLSLGGAVTTVSNSTIVGNFAGPGGNGGLGPSQQVGGAGGFGGGIASTGTLTVTQATIAGNNAGAAGVTGTPTQGRGGGIHVGAGAPTFRNSILSANTAPVASVASCNDPGFTIVDGGNNLSPAGAGCPAGFGTGNPMLGVLSDNGGPTETMSISAAGAAFNAVPATGANCAATDQRGIVRPQGFACDIGAFEITQPALLTVAKAGTGAGTVSGTGISCGADCSETVPYNSLVILSAAASIGSTFAGWSGCDSASGTTCTQTLGSNETVTATFNLVPVVSPPVATPPATPAKKCKKGQKLKKGKCVKRKRKKR